MPAASIWQWKFCELVKYPREKSDTIKTKRENQRLTSVLPLMAGELNDREVPAATAPVLVTESAALANREAKSGEI